MKKEKGFSLIELIVAMTITLVLLGVATTLLRQSLGTKTRESNRTDALTSSQAALNVMSREIANSGFGIYGANNFRENGIVLSDSGPDRLRIRSNFDNRDMLLNTRGEDVYYYHDTATKSIVRYDLTNDPNKTPYEKEPAYIINSVSKVSFKYYDPVSDWQDNPNRNTSRVRLVLTVEAQSVNGVPPKDVILRAEITLRNSQQMLRGY